MSNDKDHKKKPKAYIHGIYARDILLDWENREEFENIHEDLKLEWAPIGFSEEQEVLNLTLLHFQKRTVWRMRKCSILSDPYSEKIRRTGKKTWTGIRKALRVEAKEAFVELPEDDWDSVMNELVEQIKSLQSEISGDQESLKEKIQDITRCIRREIMPLLQSELVPLGQQAFESFYAPAGLEKLMKLEGMIDARIQKVMTRLIILKECRASGTRFKQLPAPIRD